MDPELSRGLLTSIHMPTQSNPVPASQNNAANKRWIGWLVGLTSLFAVLGVGLAAFFSQILWGYPFWRPGVAREIAEATALPHLTILEIGRASCRERVSISGVAVSLYKK